jgi:hypothetical protein
VLNGHRVTLIDVPILEQQLLGLMWKGGKITDPAGEHDDYANAVAGVVALVTVSSSVPLMIYSVDVIEPVVKADGSVIYGPADS